MGRPYRLGQIGLVGNIKGDHARPIKDDPTDWVKSD